MFRIKHVISLFIVFLLTSSFILTTSCGPQFVLGPLEASPQVCVPGEQVTIATRLTNSGGASGDYNAELFINSVAVKSDRYTLGPNEIFIPAGSSQTITLPLNSDNPGIHSVELGDASVDIDIWPHGIDIVELAKEAWSNVETYQTKANIIMNMSAGFGKDMSELKINMDFDELIDCVAKKMKSHIEMNMETTDGGKEEGAIEMYLIGDTIYTRETMSGIKADWQKEVSNLNTWDNMQMYSQQLDTLTYSSVKLVGVEMVDNVECYILETNLTGSEMWMAILKTIASGSGDTIPEDDLEALEGISQMLEGANMSFTLWVTRDAYFLKKADMSLDWSLHGIISLEMGLNMIVDSYNEPVSIEVPGEARVI